MCKNTMYFAHSRCVRTLRTLYVYATGYLCVPVETESQSYMEYTHVLNYRVKATFHYFSQLQTWSKTWSQAGRKHVESQLRVRTCLKRVFFSTFHLSITLRLRPGFRQKKSKAAGRKRAANPHELVENLAAMQVENQVCSHVCMQLARIMEYGLKRQMRVCLWLWLTPHPRDAHTWQNVSDKLHFGDKQNSQTVKSQIQNFSGSQHYLNTLNHENIAKHAQNPCFICFIYLILFLANKSRY